MKPEDGSVFRANGSVVTLKKISDTDWFLFGDVAEGDSEGFVEGGDDSPLNYSLTQLLPWNEGSVWPVDHLLFVEDKAHLLPALAQSQGGSICDLWMSDAVAEDNDTKRYVVPSATPLSLNLDLSAIDMIKTTDRAVNPLMGTSVYVVRFDGINPPTEELVASNRVRIELGGVDIGDVPPRTTLEDDSLQNLQLPEDTLYIVVRIWNTDQQQSELVAPTLLLAGDDELFQRDFPQCPNPNIS